jgi:uncharacterized protein YwqG
VKNKTQVLEEKLSDLIISMGLGARRSAIIGALKQSMRLRTRASEDALIMAGESKLGGLPDLPKGMDWPRRASGVPLGFVGQMNFTEVPDFAGTGLLPKRGIAFFFYDPTDLGWGSSPAEADRWRVILIDDRQADHHRTQPPDDLPEGSCLAPCKLVFSKELTLPPIDSPEFDALKVPHEMQEHYFDLLSALATLQGGTDEEPLHRMLGFPDQIRTNVALDCEMGRRDLLGEGSWLDDREALRVEREARRWLTLLQVDSDPALGISWGNAGRIWYLIRGEDLRMVSWENAWLVAHEFRSMPPEPDTVPDEIEEDEE